jgi:hypothetical protein
VVFEDDTAYLLDLVGFCLSPFGLEVQDLFYTFLGEDMVAPTDALSTTKTPKQLTQPVKGNIGVRGAT